MGKLSNSYSKAHYTLTLNCSQMLQSQLLHFEQTRRQLFSYPGIALYLSVCKTEFCNRLVASDVFCVISKETNWSGFYRNHTEQVCHYKMIQTVWTKFRQQKVHSNHLVELRGLFQKWSLKVLFVNGSRRIYPENHQHLASILDGDPVDLLPSSLPHHHIQQSLT